MIKNDELNLISAHLILQIIIYNLKRVLLQRFYMSIDSSRVYFNELSQSNGDNEQMKF